MTAGRVHSSESFGTVDGPGIRYVLFLQGCPMRCLYCHNPDTWSERGGRELSAADVIAEYKKNAVFYKNGGLTVTGGEPLMQLDFLTELFAMAKKEGIHTCLDTSGVTFEGENKEYLSRLDKLIDSTDLVMLDIKHIDNDKHKALTGRENANILAFARYLDEKRIDVWIRHVVLDGYTNDKESLYRLGEFIGTLKNVKALDVLPYHTMGAAKYKDMGIPYRLDGIAPLSKQDAQLARKTILEGIRAARMLKS